MARSRRSRRVSLLRIPRARSLLLAGTLALLATVAAAAAHAYTDVLWFAELGSEDVYWTTLRWKLVAYGVAGVGTAGIVLANLLIAERITGARGAARAKLPRAQRQIAYPVVAIAAGIVSAKWQAPGAWSQLALWSGRSDFGVTDPLFHRDAGFFVFSLPLYQHVVAWLLASLAMAGAAVVAAHVVAGGIRRDGRLVVERGARAHLLVLAAIALLVVSWRYRLDRYALALPHDGSPGAGYTDAHVRVPALAILGWLSVVGAGILLAAAAGRLRRLATAVTIGIALLATAAPGLVSRPLERYVVQPQKLTREQPYVSASITATRRAFALDRIAARESPGSARLTADDLARNRATVERRPAVGRGRPAPGARRAPVARALLQLPEHDARPLRLADPHRRRAAARPERAGSRRARLGEPAPRLHPRLRGDGRQLDAGGRKRASAVRADRLRRRREPARPARAARVLRRAADRATRRTSSSRAAAPRSTSPRPARGRPRTTTTAPAGSGCRAWCAARPSRCASATSTSCCPRPCPSARGSCCTATRASACARWRRSCAGTASRRPWSPAAGSSSSSAATRRAATTRTRRRSSWAAPASTTPAPPRTPWSTRSAAR